MATCWRARAGGPLLTHPRDQPLERDVGARGIGPVSSPAYGCPRYRADRRCACSHMTRSDSKGRCRSSPGAPGWQVDLRSTESQVTGSNPVWRITTRGWDQPQNPVTNGNLASRRLRPATPRYTPLHPATPRYTPLRPALTLCTRVRAGSAGSRQGPIPVQGASRLRPAQTARTTRGRCSERPLRRARRLDDGRLVHHAEILALKGGSYRLKDRDLDRTPAAD